MKKVILLNGILLLIFAVAIFTITCDDKTVTGSDDTEQKDPDVKDPDGEDPKDPDDEKPKDLSSCSVFGTFELMFPERDAPPSISGILKDGITPKTVFLPVETDGDCKLLVPHNAFCEECSGVCVDDNECVPYPKTIRQGGNVVVKGVKTASGAEEFTIETIGGKYSSAEDLSNEPFKEGDKVTFEFKGSSAVPAFTVETKGLCRLKLLNETISMEDGKDIKLQWEKPSIPNVSKIYVKVDVSYHGGTKAMIESYTDDDGELTISSNLLDKLKSYGISGFPEIEVSRKVVATDECGGVEVVIVDKIAKYIEIPGVISCNGDAECPEGEECSSDRRCRPIE